LDMMQRVIKEMVEECVPRFKITLYTKRWWSDELKEKRAVAHQLSKCSYRR
jgi:hypothetical protein